MKRNIIISAVISLLITKIMYDWSEIVRPDQTVIMFLVFGFLSFLVLNATDEVRE